MRRGERTRVLIDGDPDLRRQLANEVRAAYEVEVLQPPRRGLVMVPLRETARRARFYLGEVLVSEARVRLAGAFGLGLLVGDDAEAALDLATVDAAWSAGVPESRAWHERLRQEARRLSRQRAGEEERLLRTRVAFETMESDL